MKRLSKIEYLFVLFTLVFFASCDLQKGKGETELKSEINSTEYKEQFRNQIHFSPKANWMNDPNGMVYLDGEYHLFYQYYPDSTVWGPMHWAHAVSEDLIYWKHLPIALYPDSLGYIFSGSAVIDKNNTAGFGENAMIAIYTYHDMEGERSGTSNTYQYQAIAYSLDKGRTFTKYENNPVIQNPGIKDFRDPKVIWDEAHKQWLMVFAAHDHVKFYGSQDLKNWKHLSDWGKEFGNHKGIWECPDIFPMKVKNSNEQRWVLLQSINPGAPNGGSGTQYFIGDFDGTEFQLDASFVESVVDGKSLWIDYGTDNYAGVTWSNAPVQNDSKLFIGWMSNWQYAQVVPTEKWRSAMTIPRKLSLYKEDDKYRLRSLPVLQLSKLENSILDLPSGIYHTKTPLRNENLTFPLKLNLELNLRGNRSVAIKLSNNKNEFTLIGYDPVGKQYFIDRTNSGKSNFESGFAKLHSSKIDYKVDTHIFELIVDIASIELFANEGRTVMTDVIFPTIPYDKVELITGNNGVDVVSCTITTLESIWN